METLIRLSTAHARARLSKSIDAVDAKAAVEMVQFSHFQKVLEKPRKKKTSMGGADDESEEENDVDEEMEEEPKLRPSRRLQSKRSHDVYEFEDQEMSQTETTENESSAKKLTTSITKVVAITEEQEKQFKQILFKLFRNANAQIIQKARIVDLVNEEAVSNNLPSYTEAEIEFILNKMQDLNQIYLSGDSVILI